MCIRDRLRKLLNVRKVTKAVEDLYDEYPDDPKAFPIWREKLERLLAEYKGSLRAS